MARRKTLPPGPGTPLPPPAVAADAPAPGDPLGESFPWLYEQIFYTAADALLIANARGQILLANEQCGALFGYPVSELIGKPIEDLIPQRFRDAHRSHRSAYQHRPESRPMGMNLALWGLHADGREFPVEISLSPFRHGSIQLFCANVRDVSELRRAREILSRARQSDAVADFGRHALVTKDLHDLEQEACRLAIEHLQADRALFARCDRSDRTLVPGASLGWDEGSLDAVLAAMSERWLQRACVGRDEPLVIDEVDDAEAEPGPVPAGSGVASALMCAIPGDGASLGAVGVFTHRQRAFTRDDANFVQAIANIIGAALQRQGTEERLFQSQRLEALGQLTGGVAHDFNNLLTVVSGNLQILEERIASDPMSSKLAKSALRATGRGADLTRKLLAFSRRQTLQPRPIDVKQLLVSLADILGRTLGANIEVRVIVDDGLPAVKADPGMLDTALLNLAVNARDAMPNGGRLMLEAHSVSVRAADARLEPDLAPGDYVMLAVSDTGTGMTPEVMARAFEPFFTTKEQGKGSGLGLSLVYGFVKQSGGHIKPYSEPGLGTTIKLYLPIAADAGARPPQRAAAEVRGGDETILVVEDDDEVRDVAVAFLKRLGYRVLEAADATAALELLARETSIALLFTDVVLKSDMNGAELAERAIERRASLKVLFTSGYAANALPLGTRLGRGAELLMKPYRAEQLARMLRRTLDAPVA